MMDTIPQQQGQVVLPNDGQVTDTTNVGPGDPEYQSQTGALTSANPQQPNPPNPDQDPLNLDPAKSSSQPDNTDAPTPSGHPGQNWSQASPEEAALWAQQNKAQQPQQPPKPQPPQGVSPDNPNAYHPAVQHAGVLNTVAEALAGGPRYKVTVDPNTGQMVRQRVQQSGKNLALALASEAISGAFAGLGTQGGPNHLGRAAAAGFGQAQQQQATIKNQQDQEADENYKRGLQLFETNMRMHTSAVMIGRQAKADNDAYVAQYHDLGQKLLDNYSDKVQGIVPENQLSQYHVTKDQAIPWETTPRLDPATGKQVEDSYGVPQYDIKYLVLKPGLKAGDLLSDTDKTDAAKYLGMKNLDKMPDNIQLSLPMVLSIKSKVAAVKLAMSDLDQYGQQLSDLNNKPSQSDQAGSTSAPYSSADTDTNMWSVYKDPNKLADFITTQEGSKPTDRSVRNNNPGNIVADPSWKGPVDNTNLPQGQAPFRVYPTPAAGRADLVNMLTRWQQQNPDMTVQQFFNRYDQGNATNYAQAALQNAGIKPSQPAPGATGANTGTEPAYQVPDIPKLIAANPQYAKYLQAFQPYRANPNTPLGADIAAYSKVDPDGGAVMMQLYGGPANVKKMDDANAADKVLRQKKLEQTASAYGDELKKTQHRQEVLADNKNLINELATGTVEGLKGIATMRGNDREAIVEAAKDQARALGRTFNVADVDRAIKLADQVDDKVNGGTYGNFIYNGNTALQHMGEASQLIDRLKQKYPDFGDVSFLKKPLTYWNEKFTSDPDWGALKVAATNAATDWQNLINNGHALDQHSRDLIEQIAGDNSTLGNMQAMLRETGRTAAAKMLPVNRNWMDVMEGESLPDMIQPETLEAIRQIHSPELNQKLAELSTGGSRSGGPKGVGYSGKTVREALGSDFGSSTGSTPSQANNWGAKPGEVPQFDASGNLRAYSVNGHISRYAGQ